MTIQTQNAIITLENANFVIKANGKIFFRNTLKQAYKLAEKLAK